VIAAPVVAFLNHLLEREAWARDRLAPFAGRHIRATAALLPDLAFAIRAGGLLESAPNAEADLTMAFTPAALAALLRHDEGAVEMITFAGNADLTAAVQFLLRNLRWEVEEDLARLLGDAAAHRIARTGRDLFAWQKDAAARFGQNVAEYLTEEAALLAPPADLARFTREVTETREAVQALERRLERIIARLAATSDSG
jgi:ubiquinone biosynthesis accessory factor UbiJ